jgi:imidazolonepropionase-like amidohydrolase
VKTIMTATLVGIAILTGASVLCQQEAVIVLDGATIIDGTGAGPCADCRLVIRGNRIEAMGPSSGIQTPAGASTINLRGFFVLPGLIDHHFHIENDPNLALKQLAYGITAFRDPGQWIEQFDPLKEMMRKNHLPGPRMSLTGPHFDGPGPAYPKDSRVILGPLEARRWTEQVIDQGATAIKVYFRLSLDLIKTVIDTAHARGVPVTGHLEIVDAAEAIRLGLDGLEHITSFGVALAPLRQGEVYRQPILADNSARREGRYRMWAELDFSTPQAKALLALISERRTFVDPTLAVFERREGLPLSTSAQVTAVKGFKNMMRFVKILHDAGARVVVGSHTAVPFAERGRAFFRETELLVDCGLTPIEVIRAATQRGAEFLGREHELGTLKPSMLADLIVVEGNPAADIRALRNVRRVMVDGKWIPTREYEGY